MEEPADGEERSDVSVPIVVSRSIAVVRCARCLRLLSGWVRPSERRPERRRRAPRLPRARDP
jgi:hypothetical protein